MPRFESDAQSRSIYCLPHPFSNDQWRQRTVSKLITRLAEQRPTEKRTAGIVVGAGGLPYILGQLSLDILYIADVNNEVIEQVVNRLDQLKRSRSWRQYHDSMYVYGQGEKLDKFRKEYNTASRAQLLGDFDLTQASATRTNIRRLPGDIRDTLPRLAVNLTNEDMVVNFVNLTSVANQMFGLAHNIASFRRTRQAALGLLVGRLPLSEEAVIIDSSNFRLSPQLYTPITYPGIDKQS